jgi:hypothetical protein
MVTTYKTLSSKRGEEGSGGSGGGGSHVDQVPGTDYKGGNSGSPLSGADVHDPGAGGGPVLRNNPRTDRHDVTLSVC